MNAQLIGELGRLCGRMAPPPEKRARAGFLLNLFRPGAAGAGQALARRQVAAALQRGDSEGLSRLLGAGAGDVEAQLARRARGLYETATPAALSPQAQAYRRHQNVIQSIRNGMNVFGGEGYGGRLAEEQAALRGTGPDAMREVARARMNARTAPPAAAADRLAMSGRHGGGALMPQTLEAGGDAAALAWGMPSTAYKGFGSTSALRPGLPGAAGDGTWWSGYPAVAAGYARTAGKANPFSYVAEAPTSLLREAGPSSPMFHPHVAFDTRGTNVNALTSFRPWQARNAEWARMPHYEGVFTRPAAPAAQFSALHKVLPSGTGLQRLGGFRLAGPA